MKDTYDAVIVGSGYGGAVVACRLAQAGWSVCVLERGEFWDNRALFPRSVGEVAEKALCRPPREAGLVEYRSFGTVDVMQGVGVGGGSIPTFNVHQRADASIFRQDGWPAKLTRRTLDPYYDLVHDMLGARPLSPPAGYSAPRRTEAFLDAAGLAGPTSKPRLSDLTLHTGSPHRNVHGGAQQLPCEYCGSCLLGCHVHAKNTLDLNYLPVAQRYGAEIYARHTVSKIVPTQDEQYEVHFDRRAAGNHGADDEGGVILGKTVILAAGTLGTTELLLRCRDVHETLPHVSDPLGARFSGNGNLVLAGAWETADPIQPGRGPGSTASADFSTANHRITIDDVGYPEVFLWYLEGMRLPSLGRITDAVEIFKSFAGAAFGIGGRENKLDAELHRRVDHAHYAHFLPFFGMGSDAADGELRLDRQQRLDIAWSSRRSMQMFWDMEKAMRRISRAAGGQYRTSFLWKWPLRRMLTLHPLGGCTMSDQYAEGVVNSLGEVWNYPNLYVADGSIVPTALAVHPGATIAALAERIAFHMVNVREMRDGDPAMPANR